MNSRLLVAILDEGVNLTGEQINAGQQTDRAVALVFVIARKSRVYAGLGRQVRCGRRDRLNARLLIIGDDRHRIARRSFRRGRGLLDELHLAVDTQDFRHLGLKVGITAFQVVTDLVGLDLLLVEDVAQRALRKLAQANVPLSRSMLARVAGEKSRRPQFVGIAELLGLAAGQIHYPSLRLGRDRRLPTGAWSIIKRR